MQRATLEVAGAGQGVCEALEATLAGRIADAVATLRACGAGAVGRFARHVSASRFVTRSRATICRGRASAFAETIGADRDAASLIAKVAAAALAGLALFRAMVWPVAGGPVASARAPSLRTKLPVSVSAGNALHVSSALAARLLSLRATLLPRSRRLTRLGRRCGDQGKKSGQSSAQRTYWRSRNSALPRVISNAVSHGSR